MNQFQKRTSTMAKKPPTIGDLVNSDILGVIEDHASQPRSAPRTWHDEARKRLRGVSPTVGSDLHLLEMALAERAKRAQSTVATLDEVRDRLFSLEAKPDDIRHDLRAAFRGGYAQCRNHMRDVLAAMIAKLDPNLTPE